MGTLAQGEVEDAQHALDGLQIVREDAARAEEPLGELVERDPVAPGEQVVQQVGDAVARSLGDARRSRVRHGEPCGEAPLVQNRDGVADAPAQLDGRDAVEHRVGPMDVGPQRAAADLQMRRDFLGSDAWMLIDVSNRISRLHKPPPTSLDVSSAERAARQSHRTNRGRRFP